MTLFKVLFDAYEDEFPMVKEYTEKDFDGEEDFEDFKEFIDEIGIDHVLFTHPSMKDFFA